MKLTNWKMDYEGYRGLDCTSPCDMYSVLLQHGLISDPYYGTNEEALTGLSKKDCVFYTEFSLSQEELDKERIELDFYGLDTICHIYLNGTFIDKVMNMHRMYSYDVKSLLKEKNEIRLEFKAPMEYFEKMESMHHLYMDGAAVPGASHLRKAFYMSGWDWAPRLPNMGIFRDVEICAYNGDKIEDTEIIQSHENGQVTLTVTADTKHKTKGLSIWCKIDGQRVKLENGKGEITIENPRLWWPNNLGEQNLYDAIFELCDGECVIDTLTKTIGLRTLVLSRENDEYGQEFCFKINGIKVFAMGANYVPMDSIPTRECRERLERLIKDCIFANFNCIRVWGGAYYPSDDFYDLCDRYGLIVWQDFMMACANVWLTEDSTREFKDEAIYNAKRIRHHACLGVLCGNNEMEEAVLHWECADGNDPLVRQDYLKLYEDILPSLAAEYAPYISYTPSSPTSGGGFDYPQDPTRGDVHFWDVWHGNCGFDEYRRHKFRFCSEYGYESLPNIKTIEAFCPQGERNLLSYTMECHQKCGYGNIKILNFLAYNYQVPKDLRATAYASQLNQANAIKYGVEHFRRCRGYTMGSVYWQLNDSWPVASWSSVDYFGRYKALHYYARKFYQPVSLGLFNENGQVTACVANETHQKFEGYIKAGVMKNDFTPVCEYRYDVSVEPFSSLDASSTPNESFAGCRDAYFYAELYDKNGVLLARNTELGRVPKHFILLDPQIEVSAKSANGGVYLTLTARNFAKDVEISFESYDIPLSDNYFDLTSKNGYTVFAKTDLSPEALLNDISIMSVYDIPLR